jgi:hypothetical protein
VKESTTMSITPRLSSSRAAAGTPVDAPFAHFDGEASPRAWPRCEPASTHFELGASADYRADPRTARRYSPKYGVPKDEEPL